MLKNAMSAMGSIAATEKKFSKSCSMKSEQVPEWLADETHLNFSSKYYNHMNKI